MFTNNYINHKHNLFFGLLNSEQSVGSIYGRDYRGATDEILKCVSDDYAYYDIGRCLDRAHSGDVASSSSYYDIGGVYFGTGLTPATKDDYILESPITSGITVGGTNNILYKWEDGKATARGLYVLTNTTDADITISECGYFMPVQTFSGSGAWFVPALMDRTVLDEPVTIPPGEARLITYKITINQS